MKGVTEAARWIANYSDISWMSQGGEPPTEIAALAFVFETDVADIVEAICEVIRAQNDAATKRAKYQPDF